MLRVYYAIEYKKRQEIFYENKEIIKNTHLQS